MMKYSKDIVNKICSLIREDSYTIAEICSIVGISKDTFYKWKETKSDFSDSIKKAQNDFDEMLVAEAKKSLVKMIKGYTEQEKKTVTVDTGKRDDNNKPIIRVKEHSVIDKHYQPNPTLIIFTLTNRDSDNWKNKQDNNISGDVTLKSNLEHMSDEQLQNIVDGKEDK
jgi:transposase-like protein